MGIGERYPKPSVAHQVKEESGAAGPGADFPRGAGSHTASGEGNPVLSIHALLASGGRDGRRGHRHGESAATDRRYGAAAANLPLQRALQ